MKWRNFEYKGETYALDHLHPFICTYPHPSGDGSVCEVQIRFGMHCFTRSSKDAEEYDNKLEYKDSRESRVFDFYRHELSFRLPEAIKDLGSRKCFHTNKGNFFTIELINNEGETVEYEIFFDLHKVKRGNNGLALQVQSAYVRSDDYKSSMPKKRNIRLKVIISKRLKNQKINVQT